MKRQIHAYRGFGTIAVAGHNIKLGRGGIREIEFFVQTQQLIAGGRQPDLRVPQTLEALRRLADARLDQRPRSRAISAKPIAFCAASSTACRWSPTSRRTRCPTIPRSSRASPASAAIPDATHLPHELTRRLETVQTPLRGAFRGQPRADARRRQHGLCRREGRSRHRRGSEADGLSRGPRRCSRSCAAGTTAATPAVRSPRARERLTEVQPLLIAALADTADPDRALASFDRFMAELPSGVQLFSLLRANPSLLRLARRHHGHGAAAGAASSRRRRRLLDAVLDPRVFGVTCRRRDELDTIIARARSARATTCSTCSTARASSAASSSSSSAFACYRAPSRPTRQAAPMRFWPNA